MPLTKLLNIVGLILDIAGAFLVFYNTPKIDSNTYIGHLNTMREKDKKDALKNLYIRIGMFLIFIGFCFQLIAGVI